MWSLFSKKRYIQIQRPIAALVIALLLVGSFPSGLAAEETDGGPEEQPTEQVTDAEDTGNQAAEGDTSEAESDDVESDPDGDGGDTGADGADTDDGADTAHASSTPTDDQSVGTSTIATGDAFADSDINTQANTNTTSVDGVASTTSSSTNNAVVENTATTTATTGENSASSTEGAAAIETGDAVAVANITNVVNTNIYNSQGLLLLLNLLFGEGRLDLRDLDFESSSPYGDCSLESCGIDNIQYNLSNTNNATVTNNQIVIASTGENTASGTNASVNTGDAYAAANVVNVANTNIIDSNYIVLSINNIGDYIGDIVLPGAAFFEQFLSNALFGASDLTVTNDNTASVSNNASTSASTGGNTATSTDGGADITTGNANATTNVVNHVNENRVGGSSINILFRVQGNWSGNIFGLPEGLSWEETGEGVRIYSDVLGTSTQRSGNTTITNTNNAAIENNVEVYALTGENKVAGSGGAEVTTGNAHASTNIVNMANTTIIGMNWITMLFTILGNFDGNISFGMPDLVIAGVAESPDSPLGPGSSVEYTYTIMNMGDAQASDVVLDLTLDPRRIAFAETPDELRNSSTTARWYLGEMAPGATKELTFNATVGGGAAFPTGDTMLPVSARVTTVEPDNDESNNVEELALQVKNGTVSQFSPKKEDDTANQEPPELQITSSAEASTTAPDGTLVNDVPHTVDYTITITNDGGDAYDAFLFDAVTNAAGAAISEQSWNLGTIYSGEEISVTYSLEFPAGVTPGVYTSVAQLGAFKKEQGSTPVAGDALPVIRSTSTIEFVAAPEPLAEPVPVENLDATNSAIERGPSGSVLGASVSGVTGGQQLALADTSFLPGIFTDDCACAGGVALIVLAIFYAWSSIAYFRNRQDAVLRKSFISNTIFTLLYTTVMLVLSYVGALCELWPVLTLALAVWIGQDIWQEVVHGDAIYKRQYFYITGLLGSAALTGSFKSWCLALSLALIGLAVALWHVIMRMIRR